MSKLLYFSEAPLSNLGFEPSILKQRIETNINAGLNSLVGVRGLEPPASWSQTRRASQLRHTPWLKEFSNKYCFRFVSYLIWRVFSI